ncbi:MAG TPA: PIG-L family deacetylase [Thermoanaerobaculia bacterium]|nr:PIG-L family deacetylase [Thermoanaerobaculia bacterium]
MLDSRAVMTSKRRTALVLLLLLALSPSQLLPQAGFPAGAPSPLEPPSTGGVAAVDRALARLSTHKRLLVVAAHPDDEDTTLLTLVARGMGGESAYLSLSRGEGGQNLIGPELGVGLGLIRTRELLAARGVDGGRQFFTRAYDFGYTRSLEETLRLWPKDVLLEDAVRVIRRFRPQVVVSIFQGEPHRNHGQHQAAGVTAHEAFPLAGDPNALPQLRAEGLLPWTPQVLYRSGFRDAQAANVIPVPVAGVDPLAGKSLYQIASASRSMHRSQDMGRLQELGPQETRVVPVSGSPADAKELFAGIDTRLSAIANTATVPDAERRGHAGDHLEAAQVVAERTRTSLNPARLGDSVPAFLEILKHLRAAHAYLNRPEERPAADLIAEKIDIAETGLAAAAGIAMDATTEREALIPGETFPVQAVLWNSGAFPLAKATVEVGSSGAAAQDPAAGALAKWELQAAAPSAITTPYFLRKPLQGGLYDWSEAQPEEKGEPFEAPPFLARFSFAIEGVPVEIEREVVHRHRDQAFGEIRRPLRVVPKVEVAVHDELLVWPLARKEPRRLQVALTSHAKEAVSGRLEATAQGWAPVTPVPFTLEPGEEKTVEVSLKPAAGLAQGKYRVQLAAVLEDGGRFALAAPVVDYPHIRPTPQPEAAEVAIHAADVKLPPLKKVGYVRGASDRVPEFLLQVGVPLALLGPHELLEGDLSGYDAIVVGSRAYETDPALARANPRLLDYARSGGLVIVQYQQYAFVEGKFAPFTVEIGRPHDRVTDETAAATLLDPAHPVLTTPNRIGPQDWEGWVQERGLYFLHTWDPALVPLLAFTDPDQPETRGGLLVAKLGKGHYVYTGLAFFRQLPAGVPGAYRLFANLLSL